MKSGQLLPVHPPSVLPRAAAFATVLVLAACSRGPAEAPGPVVASVTSSPASAEAPPAAGPTTSVAVEAVVTGPPEAPPAPTTSASVKAAEPPQCAPLPDKRPNDLVLRVMRSVVPHGAPIRHEGVEVHGAATVCPAKAGPRADPVLPCRRVSAATLDAIFQELKRRRFDRMRSVKHEPSSPHYGSRTLAVVWGRSACTLDDSPWSGPPKSEEGDFFALIDAVVGAPAEVP